MDSKNDEQTQLLRNIWNEIKDLGTNLGGRIDQTNERLGQTNERLDCAIIKIGENGQRIEQLEATMAAGFTQVNGRLDNLIDFAGRGAAAIERRVEALETWRRELSG